MSSPTTRLRGSEALPQASRRLQSPYRRHRHAPHLERLAQRWAATSQLPTHELEQLATILMSEERDDQVLLYANWLIWTFCLDDHAETRTTPQALDSLFRELAGRTGAVDDNSATTDGRSSLTGGPAHAVETALSELWQQTAPRTSHHWRARFRRHLHEQYTGCLREQQLRGARAVPTPEEYPLLRRQSSGLWVYDLPEAILGIELPPAFAATALWQELVSHVSDVSNWCNDILSYPKEATDESTMNYLLVARQHLGLSPDGALDWVTGRIVESLDQAAALGRHVPGTAESLGLSPSAVRSVSRVACAVLNCPADYLAWSMKAARYTGDDAPVICELLLNPGRTGPAARPSWG